MPSNSDSFPAELVRGQMQAMVCAGFDLDTLRSLELPDEVFLGTPLPHTAQLPLPQAGRAMMRCKQLLQDESYGFSAEDKLTPGHTQLLWLSSLHERSLGEVLLEQYQLASQLGSNYGFSTHNQDGLSQWGFCRSSCDSDISPQLLQRNDLSHLYWWYRVACWFVGRMFPLESVSIMGEDYDTRAIAEQLFACPVHYDRPRFAIDFSDEYMQLPVIRNPGEVERLRTDIGEACMDVRPAVDRTIVAIVTSMLEEDASLLMERIAERLHCSRHTLIRRLQGAGTSFQKLKDEVRMNRAEQLLKNDAMSIEEVSETLGFANPPAFTRAFRGWYQQTPTQFRRQLDSCQ